ncbi:MAG: hypothetical protein JO038_02765 [Alphaproteobacteria bacterium]|nr:hypothetical protein [Alphaproteobacteria bacterium]
MAKRRKGVGLKAGIAAELLRQHIIPPDDRGSPEEAASRVVEEVFASLAKDAFRFPVGISVRPKLIENA